MNTWEWNKKLTVVALVALSMSCAKRMSIGDREDGGNGLSAVDLTFTGMSDELKEKLTAYSLGIAPQGDCAADSKTKVITESETPLQLTNGKVSIAETLTRGCEYIIKLKFKAKFKNEAGAEQEDWVYANFKTTPEDKIASEGDEITTDKATIKPEIKVYLTAVGEKYNFGVYGGFHKSDGETSLEANINFGEGIDILGTYETACTANAEQDASRWITRTVTFAYTGVSIVEESYNAAGCAADALVSKEEGEASFAIGQASQAGYPITLQVSKHTMTIGNSDAAVEAVNTFANGTGFCGKKDWTKGQAVDTLNDATITEQACKSARLGPLAAFDLFARQDDKIHFGLKDTDHAGNEAAARPVALDKSAIASATKK